MADDEATRERHREFVASQDAFIEHNRTVRDETKPLAAEGLSGDDLLRALHRQSVRQTELLASIKAAMSFFVVLAVAGIALGIWIGIEASKHATSAYP
jgi:hypothetical protein